MRRTGNTTTTTTHKTDLSKNIASTTRVRSSYSHRIADQQKDQRRWQGQQRNEAWSKLSLEDKIRSLAIRPGESRKQIQKLTGRNISAQEAVLSL